jgi:hypothetical protein
MKMIIAVLCVATMSLCVSTVAMAESNEQVSKDKNVAKTVKQLSSNEKMMPTPDVQLERLTKGLKLTVEQQKQIRPMLIDEYAKLNQLRQDENPNISPKQIQAKVEALRNEAADKIQTVLTLDQKEKHDIVRKEVRASKQKRIKENRKERLGLQAEPPPQTTK